MLFKTKKYLLPAYLACGPHLGSDNLDEVYNLFMSFCSDEIWGVRKVAIERAPEMIRMLKEDDVERIEAIVKKV